MFPSRIIAVGDMHFAPERSIDTAKLLADILAGENSSKIRNVSSNDHISPVPVKVIRRTDELLTHNLFKGHQGDDEVWWTQCFNTIDLAPIETRHSFMEPSWRYRDFSEILVKGGYVNAGLAAAKKCVEMDPHNGGYALRDLCQWTLSNPDFALQCAELAKTAYADAGSEAMMYILLSRIAEVNEAKEMDELIERSVALTREDREYGLKVLFVICLRLTD